MTTNTSGLSPYTDSGTGAVPGPPAEVTYGTEHDPEPTALVDGPPASVTVEALEHLDGPTAASPNPPKAVTTTQHPAKTKAAGREGPEPEPEPEATDPVEVKAVQEAENKAVIAATTKAPPRRGR